MVTVCTEFYALVNRAQDMLSAHNSPTGLARMSSPFFNRRENLGSERLINSPKPHSE